MSGHTHIHIYTHTHTHTHTHTYTHDNYYNPRCAHAHRGLIIIQNTKVWGKILALIVALILSPVLFALSIEGATKLVDKAVPASVGS